MGFYERLIGGNLPENEPKIPVHQFFGMIGEWERNQVTVQQVINAFSLSPSEQAEVTQFLNKIVNTPEVISIGSLMTLTNIGTSYDGSGALGLGFARLQTAGISAFDFSVRVNKVGTGIQDWQLWNDTDSSEIAVISDSGAAGVKYLSTTQTLPSPLGAGFKFVRVRGRSSVAADDPIFLGASLGIQRVGRFSSAEAEQIFCIAEQGIIPYDSVAAVKTRLGV